MIDCYPIRQGMIFFVDDITSAESVLFKGEKLPRKRRPWIVMSNNRNNAYAPHVTMIPTFTGTELHLPTQISFMCNGKERIARAEMINCIPKELIDVRGYVGTLSEPIFNKLQKALKIHLEIEDENSDKIENSLITTLKSANVENIIATKVCEILFKGLNTNTSNNYTFPINSESKETSHVVNDVNVKEDNTITNNVITECTPNNVSIIEKTEENTTKKISKLRGKRGPYKPRGQIMTLEQCLKFYQDTISMSQEEIYNKWKDFGIENTKTSLSKKKYSIKQRLIKEGMLVGE